MMKTTTHLNFIALLLFLIPIVSFAQYPGNIPAKLKIAESLSSGNWNDRTIWSNDKFPGDSTFIIIHPGHTITMTADATCESLVIYPEGTLDNGGFDLTIYFMEGAHGVSASSVDDGVTYYGYAPIDASWSIYNPNNGNWNIYKVDGLHTGSGHTHFGGRYPGDPNDLGFTFTGSGVVSTGSMFYKEMGQNGAKFNSACTMEIYADLYLIDIVAQNIGGLPSSTNNYGNIILKNGAGFIGASAGGTFNNMPGGYLKLEGGTLVVGPVDVFLFGGNIAGFVNDGVVEVLGGNLEIPYFCYYQNNSQTTVTGNILGTDSENSSDCVFYQGAEGATLTIGGAIFPPENPGELVCYMAEPNYVIYNGDANQNITVPTEFYDGSTPTPYSNLIISNSNATATLSADITVNGNLVIKPGAAFTVESSGTLTVGGDFTIESDDTGTGSFISATSYQGNVQRYIAGHENAGIERGWHLLSAPVSSQPISAFHTAGSGDDFYKWSEADALWINRTTASNDLNLDFETNFVNGRGYLVANVNTDTKPFAGMINTANVNVSNLSHTGSTSFSGWQLLGNPFSSALLWNDGNWALSNVDANAQVWNETNASYQVVLPNGIIPEMNGFFVRTNQDGASLTFPATSRVHSNTPWFKSPASDNRIVLTAIDPVGQMAQPTIIRFNPNATLGYDSEYDSYFLAGFAPRFYSLSQNENYSLNTLPMMNEGYSIPLGFIKNSNSNYSIQLSENELNETLYITDHKLNTTHNFNDGDYSFSASSGDNPDRFTLHFGMVAVPSMNEMPSLKCRYLNGELIVSGASKGSLYVFDLQGKMVYNNVSEDQGENKYAIQLNRGVYLVQLKNNTSSNATKLIVQ